MIHISLDKDISKKARDVVNLDLRNGQLLVVTEKKIIQRDIEMSRNEVVIDSENSII